MAEKGNHPHCDVLLLHGREFGWIDVGNLQRYLQERGCKECWIYLETAPVDRVQRAIEEDERLQLRVSDAPKKAAKAFYKELRGGERTAEMLRLEKVSDRSMNKGAC
jgi:hypothetical protein